MNLWVVNVCLLLIDLEQISLIFGQSSWPREICWLKSNLEANDFPHSQWCNHTRHTIDFWTDVLLLFNVHKYTLTNAGIVHKAIEVIFSFGRRQLHSRVKDSSKICISVDNNLLPKIPFRQESVTFSAVDVDRKCWPKPRLFNLYGNTNHGIRKRTSQSINLLNCNCGDASISMAMLQHAASVGSFMLQLSGRICYQTRQKS